MNKRPILAAVLNASAFAISILPAAICTCCYFPLWINKGPATIISGISLILILISAIPLFKLLKNHFASASAYMVWLVLFVLFFMLSRIANEMTVISFVGFITNVCGAILFRIAKRVNEKEQMTNNATT